MPRDAASISVMLTMPVGVLTTDYIDVWCNTATDTPHKICVGDMIAVKWNADVHDREYTWCTVLATTHVASGTELTLMHEQAVDVPGHPSAEPTHVTYNWKVYTSDYRTKWMVSRLVVDACGMRRGDVSRDLSRSGLRRECGLAARHLVRVVVVTDIVLHIRVI